MRDGSKPPESDLSYLSTKHAGMLMNRRGLFVSKGVANNIDGSGEADLSNPSELLPRKAKSIAPELLSILKHHDAEP
jgi:hypothetical protein